MPTIHGGTPATPQPSLSEVQPYLPSAWPPGHRVATPTGHSGPAECETGPQRQRILSPCEEQR